MPIIEKVRNIQLSDFANKSILLDKNFIEKVN